MYLILSFSKQKIFVVTLAFLVDFSISQTVTIFTLQDYSTALSCVQACLYCTSTGVNRVFCLSDAGVLNCASRFPYLDSCYCRADLQSDATNFLSDCASSRCTGRSRDIASAINIYQDYCNGKDSGGLPTVTDVQSEVVVQTSVVQTQLVEQTQTTVTGTITTKVPSVVTVVVQSTLTTTLSSDINLDQLMSQANGSQGLQTGDKVAIAVGVVLGLAILGMLGWVVILRTKNSMMQKELEVHRNGQFGGIQQTSQYPN